MASLLKGWRTNRQIQHGLGVSPTTLWRALGGKPVGDQFIAACSAAFGRESYPDLFDVEVDECPTKS
jgi:hypothetical protein